MKRREFIAYCSGLAGFSGCSSLKTDANDQQSTNSTTPQSPTTMTTIDTTVDNSLEYRSHKIGGERHPVRRIRLGHQLHRETVHRGAPDRCDRPVETESQSRGATGPGSFRGPCPPGRRDATRVRGRHLFAARCREGLGRLDSGVHSIHEQYRPEYRGTSLHSGARPHGGIHPERRDYRLRWLPVRRQRSRDNHVHRREPGEVNPYSPVPVITNTEASPGTAPSMATAEKMFVFPLRCSAPAP